jgi:thioredoxin reductase
MYREKIFDVVIIGGGPAGLSAALVLGRSLRNVVLIDEGKPRNRVSHVSNGFLTRDGIHPIELRNIAHKELNKYETIKRIDNHVVDVTKNNRLFHTFTRDGHVFLSRKVIFSTGIKDHLPDIPGLQKVYGTSVFPCPYCDGWERRYEPLAVFGNGEFLLHFVKLIYHWSKDVIVFTNGPAKMNEERQELIQRNIRIIESPIVELQSHNGLLHHVVLATGEAIHRKGGFLMDTGGNQATMIPMKIGVPINEKGGYETKEHGKTNVDGLYIIGDAKNLFTGLICAAGEGYEAGVAINHELVEEDWNIGI